MLRLSARHRRLLGLAPGGPEHHTHNRSADTHSNHLVGWTSYRLTSTIVRSVLRREAGGRPEGFVERNPSPANGESKPPQELGPPEGFPCPVSLLRSEVMMLATREIPIKRNPTAPRS